MPFIAFPSRALRLCGDKISGFRNTWKNIQDGIQLRNLDEFRYVVVQVYNSKSAFCVLTKTVANENRAQPGGINERNVRQIEDDVFRSARIQNHQFRFQL